MYGALLDVKSISVNFEARVLLSLTGCSPLDEVGIEDFEACVLFSLAVGALSG